MAHRGAGGGETAFSFCFSTQQLCETPPALPGEGRGGGSQRGVSLFTLRQDSRATLKCYRSFFHIC